MIQALEKECCELMVLFFLIVLFGVISSLSIYFICVLGCGQGMVFLLYCSRSVDTIKSLNKTGFLVDWWAVVWLFLGYGLKGGWSDCHDKAGSMVQRLEWLVSSYQPFIFKLFIFMLVRDLAREINYYGKAIVRFLKAVGGRHGGRQLRQVDGGQYVFFVIRIGHIWFLEIIRSEAKTLRGTRPVTITIGSLHFLRNLLISYGPWIQCINGQGGDTETRDDGTGVRVECIICGSWIPMLQGISCSLTYYVSYYRLWYLGKQVSRIQEMEQWIVWATLKREDNGINGLLLYNRINDVFGVDTFVPNGYVGWHPTLYFGVSLYLDTVSSGEFFSYNFFYESTQLELSTVGK